MVKVETRLTKVVRMVAAFALMAASAGCSGGAAPNTSENLGTNEEATSESSCATVTANQTFTGGFSIVTPSSYNKCTKTYVVDVNDISATYTGHGNCGDGGFEVVYDGPNLSPTDCPNYELRSIIYHKVGSSWVVLHDDDIFGEVGPLDECLLNMRQTGLIAGDDYRVAATSRDPSGNTEPMEIYTVTRCNIQ